MRTNEIKNEIDAIKKQKEKIKLKDLNNETKQYIYGCQQHKTIRSFVESICTSKASIVEAKEDLLENLV